jgi:hypothetical protein
MRAHIPEIAIERLALGTLSRAKSLRVQRHLLACGPCLRRLVEVEGQLAEKGLVYARVLVPGLRKPLHIVHDTADGFIYSRAERRGRKWLARHWGTQLDGGRECATMREANEYLICSFSELFPEHRCTERCQPVAHESECYRDH